MLIGRVGGVRGDQHRVAIRRGARTGGGADHRAGARLVFNHHGLAGLLGDALADSAADLVGGAAGCERHDESNGLGGERLGQGAQGQGRGQQQGQAALG
ncbi:hypothetical protein D3C71_1669280 [compost metagenome]